jgi:hypothetical protein
MKKSPGVILRSGAASDLTDGGRAGARRLAVYTMISYVKRQEQNRARPRAGARASCVSLTTPCGLRKSAASELDHEIGGSSDPEPLRVQTKVVVLVRTPRSRPVPLHPLRSLPVRGIDELGGLGFAQLITLHRPPNECFSASVAEDVQYVLSCCKKRLRTATDDDHRPACDSFLDHTSCHRHQTVLSRRERRLDDRRHPLLGRERHRAR